MPQDSPDEKAKIVVKQELEDVVKEEKPIVESTDFDEQFKSIQEQFDKLKLTLFNKLEDERLNHQNEVFDLKCQLDKNKIKVSELKNSNDKLEKQLEKSNSKNVKLQEKITGLKEELEKSRKETSDFETQVDELEDRIDRALNDPYGYPDHFIFSNIHIEQFKREANTRGLKSGGHKTISSEHWNRLDEDEKNEYHVVRASLLRPN